MKLIKLTQGQFVQVDDWNYDWLSEWKWYARKAKKTYYATRKGPRAEGGQQMIDMHRLIMDTPDNMLCDHKDHNGLNCLEENIRNCTRSQNNSNRSSCGEIKYLGVSIAKIIKRDKIYEYIKAQIRINGVVIHLGCLKTPEAAARRYDAAAKYFHGEFANLNFK